VLAAAQAAIPAGLLEALQGSSAQLKSASAGRAGAQTVGQRRGRPNGTRRGEPRAGARLNVIETLRAAAPWQTVRRLELARAAEAATAAAAPAPIGSRDASSSPARAPLPPRPTSPSPRILVRREDFHINRVKQRTATTTVFVVDASGSSALNRLAEAKGAVELLLADCYVRRDQVAVLAFRGKGCELLLPPTRSLVRAKRSLAGLPGGGGTPLASAIDAAAALGESIARRGETPVIVMLTDGRGNIARDGSPGRARATEDVKLAARQFRSGGLGALLIDTSPQPVPAARQLATEMGATYLPLPYAGSSALSKVVGQAVRTVQSAPSARGASATGTSR
jgi:magnesium chelatase subunit D